MSTIVFFTTLTMILGTVLLVFGMRYASVNQQARARLAQDQALSSLITTAAAAQAETAATLAALQATLTEVNARLAGVEKILQAVE